MKYKCLVMDHDDTTVNSTATVHYPCFVEFMKKYHPEVHMSLDEYFIKNFDPGILELFRNIIGMDENELNFEFTYWNDYVQKVVPKAYPGIREILTDFRNAGGKLCVVSHSYTENILRDYRENGLPQPDLIFGWESPEPERKPAPFPLYRIMEAFDIRPVEMLVVDDLKPGYDMAVSAGVPFTAAGWANDIPEIESFMRKNSDLYFKTTGELREHLFG